MLTTLLALLLSACGSDRAQGDVADGTADARDTEERQFPDSLESDYIRSLPLAELLWTYTPSDPARFMAGGGSYMAADGDKIVMITSRKDGDGSVTEVTALSPDGAELWHAPVPRVPDLLPLAIDSQGATWVFGDQVIDIFWGQISFAYRIDAQGHVLWGDYVEQAHDDLDASRGSGLSVTAIALDADDNAYGVHGRSVFSMDPAGNTRWTYYIPQAPGPACANFVPIYSPVVVGRHLWLVHSCESLVLDVDGNEVGRPGPWVFNDFGVGAPHGGLTRRRLDGAGMDVADPSGNVLATWPAVEARKRVFDAAGRVVAIGLQSGIGPWEGANQLWVAYASPEAAAYVWMTDVADRLMIVHDAYGEIVVADRDGKSLYHGQIGLGIEPAVPVSVRPGEWVFKGYLPGRGEEWRVVCARLPFGPLTPNVWATQHGDSRNSRYVPQTLR